MCIGRLDRVRNTALMFVRRKTLWNTNQKLSSHLLSSDRTGQIESLTLRVECTSAQIISSLFHCFQ